MQAVEHPDDAVRLAGNKIYCAWSGRSEIRVIRVVAHGEALRGVPKRRDGVAIVVVHH